MHFLSDVPIFQEFSDIGELSEDNAAQCLDYVSWLDLFFLVVWH